GVLGAWVGSQFLLEEGGDSGKRVGFPPPPGRAPRLPETVPTPHIGWNRLHGAARHPLLKGLEDRYVYFVHSYAPEGVPDELILARCTHGREFVAAVGQGRVMGTQFHPERSGSGGLRLLSNLPATPPG